MSLCFCINEMSQIDATFFVFKSSGSGLINSAASGIEAIVKETEKGFASYVKTFNMRSSWAAFLLLVILQTVGVFGGHHHGNHNSLAHILAAGLIVQLLGSAGKHHGHHHHHGHESRHAYGAEPYSSEWGGLEESRIQPEASLNSGSWTPRSPIDMAGSWSTRSPIDISYSHGQFDQPILESYSLPYYYPPPAGLWRL